MKAENQKTEVLKNTAVPTSRRRILCRVQLIGGKEAKHRSCMYHVLLRAGLLTDRPLCVLYWQRLALVLALAALVLANENLVGCLGRLHYNNYNVVRINYCTTGYWLR